MVVVAVLVIACIVCLAIVDAVSCKSVFLLRPEEIVLYQMPDIKAGEKSQPGQFRINNS